MCIYGSGKSEVISSHEAKLLHCPAHLDYLIRCSNASIMPAFIGSRTYLQPPTHWTLVHRSHLHLANSNRINTLCLFYLLTEGENKLKSIQNENKPKSIQIEAMPFPTETLCHLLCLTDETVADHARGAVVCHNAK